MQAVTVGTAKICVRCQKQIPKGERAYKTTRKTRYFCEICYRETTY